MATQIFGTGSVPAGEPPKRNGALLQGYFTGGMVPCPVGCGGASEVVRLGTLADGSGELWFECTSCAQRARVDVPVATAAERAQVAADLDADRAPACPRHSRREELQRRGRRLLCGACGVVFRG
jgi:hypothetical protein